MGSEGPLAWCYELCTLTHSSDKLFRDVFNTCSIAVLTIIESLHNLSRKLSKSWDLHKHLSVSCFAAEGFEQSVPTHQSIFSLVLPVCVEPPAWDDQNEFVGSMREL